MSEKVQTEGEVVVKTPELDEAVADGTNEVEPANSAVEKEETTEELTDEQILDNLQKSVIHIEDDAKKESRKTRAIKKSIKEYDEALVGDDEIDFSILAEKFQKNEKGLESFAKAHNYDYEELLNEVKVEINGVQDPYKQKLEELQSQIDTENRKKEEQEFRNTLVSLIAQRGDITLRDFNEQHGETFSLLVDGLITRGKTPVEAAKEAFNKIAPVTTSEKEELLRNMKTMPLGKMVVQEKQQSGLDSAKNVNNPDLYTDEQRLAYKKRYMQPNGVVKYK